MVHHLCTTLVVCWNIHTILQEFIINNNRISHQQLRNIISTAVIVLYFWIYNVFCGLTWNLQSYCVNEIMLHVEFCSQQAKWRSINCLWYGIWSGISWWSCISVGITPFSTALTHLYWTNVLTFKPLYKHFAMWMESILSLWMFAKAYILMALLLAFQPLHLFLSFWDINWYGSVLLFSTLMQCCYAWVVMSSTAHNYWKCYINVVTWR